MKINGTMVGNKVTITLVVLSVAAKETRAKKPYLQLELFDGTDKIMGNFWDWGGKNMPSINDILDVDCTVTEWQGTKQLNISALRYNKTRHLSEFVPQSSHDISTAYKDLYALMVSITNDTLRTIALRVLEDLREEWITVPGAKSVHHAYVGGTLVHSLSTCRTAKALAEAIPEANVELCMVGAALHDLGKLFTYHTEGVVIDTTDAGKLYEHSFIGANYINTLALDYAPDELDEDVVGLLVHIILSHHGKLEYGAIVPPKFLEAYIVHHADLLDAEAEQLRDYSKKATNDWTDKIWTMNNQAHVSIQGIREIMARRITKA